LVIWKDINKLSGNLKWIYVFFPLFFVVVIFFVFGIYDVHCFNKLIIEFVANLIINLQKEEEEEEENHTKIYCK
jgi:hypothetical protein